VFLSYNGFTHANNEVSFTWTETALRSQAGIYYARKVRIDGHGVLDIGATTQAAITASIRQMVAAYSADGGNFIFYQDDGQTPTAHVLLNSQCNGGVRVVQPITFPQGGAGEYVPGYGRTYSFALEGELALTSENVTLHFQETIEINGTGGPIRVWQPVAQGPWIRQQTAQLSTYRATQSGSALALYGSPGAPVCIFGDSEIYQQRRISYGSPQRYGYLDWPASWSYTGESTGSLPSTPSPVPSL
jgi:hypothetical protein